MSPRPRPSANELAPWAIVAVAGVTLLLSAIVWLGGTIAAAATGAGWNPPPFALSTFAELAGHGARPIWPGASPLAVYTGIVAVSAAVVACVVPLVKIVRGSLGRGTGLAGARELAALAPEGIAARARELRPSLKGVKELEADDTGNLLGDLSPKGPELRSSFEDVELDLMAPRAGKSTGIAIPRVLRARGAVLLTSNKSDVYAVTRAERARTG
ncbi:hypothetical protein ACH4WY_49970, partial [Streptomyces sp. NPDC020951]